MGRVLLIFVLALALLLDTQLGAHAAWAWFAGVLGALHLVCIGSLILEGGSPQLHRLRPRIPWRLLGHVSQRARRRAGGHWEYWIYPQGMLGEGGYTWTWERVARCHLLADCPSCSGYGCGLICCEHYGSLLGDNAVQAEPDPAWEQALLQVERACLAWEQERAEWEWERIRQHSICSSTL